MDNLDFKRVDLNLDERYPEQLYFQKAIELLNEDEYKSGTDLELLKKVKLALSN